MPLQSLEAPGLTANSPRSSPRSTTLSLPRRPSSSRSPVSSVRVSPRPASSRPPSRTARTSATRSRTSARCVPSSSPRPRRRRTRANLLIPSIDAQVPVEEGSPRCCYHFEQLADENLSSSRRFSASVSPSATSRWTRSRSLPTPCLRSTSSSRFSRSTGRCVHGESHCS